MEQHIAAPFFRWGVSRNVFEKGFMQTAGMIF